MACLSVKSRMRTHKSSRNCTNLSNTHNTIINPQTNRKKCFDISPSLGDNAMVPKLSISRLPRTSDSILASSSCSWQRREGGRLFDFQSESGVEHGTMGGSVAFIDCEIERASGEGNPPSFLPLLRCSMDGETYFMP